MSSGAEGEYNIRAHYGARERQYKGGSVYILLNYGHDRAGKGRVEGKAVLLAGPQGFTDQQAIG